MKIYVWGLDPAYEYENEMRGYAYIVVEENGQYFFRIALNERRFTPVSWGDTRAVLAEPCDYAGIIKGVETALAQGTFLTDDPMTVYLWNEGEEIPLPRPLPDWRCRNIIKYRGKLLTFNYGVEAEPISRSKLSHNHHDDVAFLEELREKMFQQRWLDVDSDHCRVHLSELILLYSDDGNKTDCYTYSYKKWYVSLGHGLWDKEVGRLIEKLRSKTQHTLVGVDRNDNSEKINKKPIFSAENSPSFLTVMYRYWGQREDALCFDWYLAEGDSRELQTKYDHFLFTDDLTYISGASFSLSVVEYNNFAVCVRDYNEKFEKMLDELSDDFEGENQFTEYKDGLIPSI